MQQNPFINYTGNQRQVEMPNIPSVLWQRLFGNNNAILPIKNSLQHPLLLTSKPRFTWKMAAKMVCARVCACGFKAELFRGRMPFCHPTSKHQSIEHTARFSSRKLSSIHEIIYMNNVIKLVYWHDVISVHLIAVTANSHQEIVGFNISMNEVLVVNIFHSSNHLCWQYHKSFVNTY